MDSPPVPDATTHQIRGGSLLVAGRVIALAINFASQVLIARYLSKTDFGAFAYALSIVLLGQSIVTFGLDRAIARFVPIYQERGDWGRLFGTIVMVLAIMGSLGLALVLLVHGVQGFIGRSVISDPEALALLTVLIILSPVQAVDDLMLGMFAVFSRPREIFFRRYVLAPGLKLGVVILLVAGGAGVRFLAWGYLVAGLLGVAVYSVVLFGVLARQGLFRHFDRRTLRIPAAEVLGFTIPLLSSDLVNMVMASSDVILLGRFRNTAEVAAFRVVLPAAKLNELVLVAFTLLYTPLAARLFARGDREGIDRLYWETAIWMAVISFPIFALTFGLAKPMTTLLFGERYASSGVFLALLSFGYYFNAALGFNGLTLKVFGRLRYIVGLNLLTVVVNIGVNLLLIPRYGALGAAIGTSGTLVAHNLLKQAGLRLGTGIALFQRRYLRVYLSVGLGAAGLGAVQLLVSSVYVGIALAGVASFLVLHLNRDLLRVHETFPELLRLPLARRLLGVSGEGPRCSR
ncbi:MAG: flippase [Actinomycetota bacterium]